MKKLTYEKVKSYIESFEGYKLLSEEYEGANSKLIVKHLKCGTEYKVTFSKFKHGCRCFFCCREKKKLTYEYVKSYIENFKEYELVSEEYINSYTKLIIKHLECGTNYEVTLNNFKNGRRCPLCKGNRISEKKRFRYEDVKNYIESFDRYKLISKEYINSNTKLIVRHLECGTKYEVDFEHFKKGNRCPFCFGGMKTKFLGIVGQPLYDTYSHQIKFCEEVRRDPENYHALQVRCKNSSCREWFTPTTQQIKRRVRALEGKSKGEYNFYCSENCKNTCSIYRQHLYPKGHKPYRDSLERDPYWRQLVLERDNFECQICGTTENLEAHHIDSINTNPIMSADLENGVTLCKECHKKVHEDVGCRYIDLTKNKICEEKDEENYNTE